MASRKSKSELAAGKAQIIAPGYAFCRHGQSPPRRLSSASDQTCAGANMQRFSGLSVAMMVFSTAPAMADVWTFETPSQNIQCSVGEDFDTETDIFCTIIQRRDPPAIPRPASCKADWGHDFTLREYGPAKMLCRPLNRSKGGFDTAEYDVTADLGGIICSSSRKGLRCTNRDGHGFFLSRAVQSVF